MERLVACGYSLERSGDYNWLVPILANAPDHGAMGVSYPWLAENCFNIAHFLEIILRGAVRSLSAEKTW